MRWNGLPARGSELLVDRPLTARRLDGLGQTLIGDLEAAIASLAPGAPTLRLYAPAPRVREHALRIGRTSALLITPAPLSVVDGWRDGCCATSVDDGWAAVVGRSPTRRGRSCRRPQPISPRLRPQPPS